MSKNRRSRWLGVLAAGCWLLACGCAKNKDMELPELFTPVYAPLPPVCLTGPIGEVLAAAPPFSAHVEEMQGGLRVAGELFGLDGKLVFAPEPDARTVKETPEEIFTFIWIVKEKRGYLLNEALQGYAPVSFGIGTTNQTTTSDLVTERSKSLGDFPVSFASGTGAGAVTVKLSKVRLKAAAADLFVPPKSFTMYKSPEIMAREVALRRRNLKF